MSKLERERSHLVRQTQAKQLSQSQASERLGIGVRQFKRLVRSWKQQGDAGLVSRSAARGGTLANTHAGRSTRLGPMALVDLSLSLAAAEPLPKADVSRAASPA